MKICDKVQQQTNGSEKQEIQSVGSHSFSILNIFVQQGTEKSGMLNVHSHNIYEKIHM